MAWLLVSTLLQLAALVLLGVVLLSLARQIGVLHERTAPLGVLTRQVAVSPGAKIPDRTVRSLTGAEQPLHQVARQNTLAALLFVAPDCPICASLLPEYDALLTRHQGVVTGYWVASGLDVAACADYARDHGLDAARFLLSQELAVDLQVRQLPSLVLLASDGHLLTSVAVQSRRQLRGAFDRAAALS